MSVKLPYMDTSALQRGLDSIGNALQEQKKAMVEQQTASAGLALKRKYNDMVNQFTQEKDFNIDWGQKARDLMGSAIDEVSGGITDEATKQAWVTSMASQMEDHTQTFRSAQVQKQGEFLQLDTLARVKKADELASTDPTAALDEFDAVFKPTYDKTDPATGKPAADAKVTGFSQAALMTYGSPAKAFEAFTAGHDAMVGKALQTKLDGVLNNDQYTLEQKAAALWVIGSQSADALNAQGFHVSSTQKTALTKAVDENLGAVGKEMVDKVAGAEQTSAEAKVAALEQIRKSGFNTSQAKTDVLNNYVDTKIHEFKAKVGDENYAAASVGISAFSAGLDPKTGNSSLGLTFSDTADGKPVKFSTPLEALKGLNEGKIAVTQSDEQKTALANQLESAAKWQTLTKQGLVDAGLKTQHTALVTEVTNKWRLLTPEQKNADLNANAERYSDVLHEILPMLSAPSELKPVVQSTYDYAKEKLKTMPDALAVVEQFINTDANARLKAGEDSKKVNAAIKEMTDELATKGANSVVMRAIGVKDAAGTTALAQDPKWIGAALGVAAKGQLPMSTMLHDNLRAAFVQKLAPMAQTLKINIGDIGDISQTSEGFVFKVSNRSGVITYRYNGDDTGALWLDRKDGAEWTKTAIEIAKPANEESNKAAAAAATQEQLATQKALTAKLAQAEAQQKNNPGDANQLAVLKAKWELNKNDKTYTDLLNFKTQKGLK